MHGETVKLYTGSLLSQLYNYSSIGCYKSSDSHANITNWYATDNFFFVFFVNRISYLTCNAVTSDNLQSLIVTKPVPFLDITADISQRSLLAPHSSKRMAVGLIHDRCTRKTH